MSRSSEETTNLVARYLADALGKDAVRVEFFDLANPEVEAGHPDVIKAVADNQLRYPLVAINGNFRYSGAISYRVILRDVQEILHGDSKSSIS